MRRYCARGITFLELGITLVVLVLAVLLLCPMLRRHGAQARIQTCMCHQRALATAITSYAYDYGAYFPADAPVWSRRLDAYVAADTFHCPAQRGAGTPATPGYAFAAPLYAKSPRAVTAPATTCLLADGQPGVYAAAVPGDLAERHAGKTLAAFVDGHIEYRHARRLPGGAADRLVVATHRDRYASISLVSPDGQRWQPVTECMLLQPAPALSPDGAHIAYFDEVNDKFDLYLINGDGSGKRRLTHDGLPKSSFCWSPDGRRIALTIMRKKNKDIYLLTVATGAMTRLTTDPGHDSSPAWSPDGRTIAFSALRDGAMGIYTVQVDGTRRKRLTAEDLCADYPAWSPDGRYLAFTATCSNGDDDVYRMNADGTHVRRLTHDYGSDSHPCWSPDGREIAFTSARNGQYGIFLMRADGSQETPIIFHPDEQHMVVDGAWR
jgi:Tol biopolymer transport system component